MVGAREFGLFSAASGSGKAETEGRRHCLPGATRMAAPVPTILPNHTDAAHHLVPPLYLDHNILR